MYLDNDLSLEHLYYLNRLNDFLHIYGEVTAPALKELISLERGRAISPPMNFTLRPYAHCQQPIAVGIL